MKVQMGIEQGAESVDEDDGSEAANGMKSHLLANMSHEIRNPVSGLPGMAQVMALEDLGTLQRERLNVIRTSGKADRSTQAAGRNRDRPATGRGRRPRGLPPGRGGRIQRGFTFFP